MGRIETRINSPSGAGGGASFTGDPNIVVITSAGGALASSAVTATALSYLDATSSVQTQLDTKASGSGTSGRVAYWSGASSLTADANFTWSGTILGVALDIKLNEAGTAAGAAFVRNEVADGSVTYSGGSSPTNGGNVVGYGGSHATKAGDIELRSGSTINVLVDGPTGNTYIGSGGAAVIAESRLQVLYTVPGGGETTDAFGIASRVFHSGNTAATGSSVEMFGGDFDYRRTITANTTDTLNAAGSVIGTTRIDATGFTLTNTGTNGFSCFFAQSPTLVGGTLAYTHWAGFRMAADTTATGSNKYGLYVGALTGASNNYAIYTNAGLVRFGDTVTTASTGIVWGTAGLTTVADSSISISVKSGATNLFSISSTQLNVWKKVFFGTPEVTFIDFPTTYITGNGATAATCFSFDTSGRDGWAFKVRTEFIGRRTDSGTTDFVQAYKSFLFKRVAGTNTLIDTQLLQLTGRIGYVTADIEGAVSGNNIIAQFVGDVGFTTRGYSNTWVQMTN